MHQTRHMQLIWREFKALPREDRLAAFDEALMQRQVIESLDYPVTESFDEYQTRVWAELEL